MRQFMLISKKTGNGVLPMKYTMSKYIYFFYCCFTVHFDKFKNFFAKKRTLY
jgi:hypothetical protein